MKIIRNVAQICEQVALLLQPVKALEQLIAEMVENPNVNAYNIRGRLVIHKVPTANIDEFIAAFSAAKNV